MSGDEDRDLPLRILRGVGAFLGYGGLAAFLLLLGAQVYHWFRDGEWTHFGLSEGFRDGLYRCCVKDGDTGAIATFAHWLDAPVNWLGLHKVLEVVPASLGLFALSILGNSLFIYCSDRLDERRAIYEDSLRETGGASPSHK